MTRQKRQMMSDHIHNYRLMVSVMSNGEIGIERFLSNPPLYMFKCDCGEIERADLHEAVERGWLAVMNDEPLPRRKFDR